MYLAEHPALAALEVRVHLDLPFELLPADYVLMHVSVPEASVVEASGGTAASGDSWLAEGRSAALRVPSVLISHSWNILLNPLHPDAAQAEVLGNQAFGFDPRLWRPLAGER